MKRKTKTKRSTSEDLPKPLAFSDIKKLVKPRDALTPAPARALELSVVLAAESQPRVEVTTTQLERGRVLPKGSNAYQVSLSVQGVVLGAHAFPPSVQVRKVPAKRKLNIRPEDVKSLERYLPDHRPLRPFPE